MKEVLPEDYSLAVKQLAYHKKGRRFLSSSNEEALLVAGLIVKDAEETGEVLIYSKSLEHKFYREILKDSKCHLRMILDLEIGVNVVRSLPQDVRNRIQVRVLSPRSLRSAEPSRGAHFIVFGDALRFELNGDELCTLSSFNERQSAQKLCARFEKLWEHSVPFVIHS